MRKLGLIMLGVVIGIVLISFVLKSCQQPSTMPTMSQAQYLVQADNRYYYTNSYESKTDRYFGKYILLHGYWETANDKDWTYHGTDLKLSYKSYPKLVVARRG